MPSITTKQVSQLALFLDRVVSQSISRSLAATVIDSMTVEGFFNDYARVANSGIDRGMSAQVSFKTILSDYDNNKVDIMTWCETMAKSAGLSSVAEWIADLHNHTQETDGVSEINSALNAVPLKNESDGTELTFHNNDRLTYIVFLWHMIAESLCLQYAQYIEPDIPYNPHYL